ncbi:hypothetical protein GCM10023078_18950 [Gibbsiella greigii]
MTPQIAGAGRGLNVPFSRWCQGGWHKSQVNQLGGELSLFSNRNYSVNYFKHYI